MSLTSPPSPVPLSPPRPSLPPPRSGRGWVPGPWVEKVEDPSLPVSQSPPGSTLDWVEGRGWFPRGFVAVFLPVLRLGRGVDIPPVPGVPCLVSPPPNSLPVVLRPRSAPHPPSPVPPNFLFPSFPTFLLFTVPLASPYLPPLSFGSTLSSPLLSLLPLPLSPPPSTLSYPLHSLLSPPLSPPPLFPLPSSPPLLPSSSS